MSRVQHLGVTARIADRCDTVTRDLIAACQVLKPLSFVTPPYVSGFSIRAHIGTEVMADLQSICKPRHSEPPRNRGDCHEYVGLLQVSNRSASAWRPGGVSQVPTQHLVRMLFVPRHHLLSGVRDFSFRLELLELLHLVDPPEGPRKYLADRLSAQKRAIEIEYNDPAEYVRHANRYMRSPPIRRASLLGRPSELVDHNATILEWLDPGRFRSLIPR
jgi:hypothetical protein